MSTPTGPQDPNYGQQQPQPGDAPQPQHQQGQQPQWQQAQPQPPMPPITVVNHNQAQATAAAGVGYMRKGHSLILHLLLGWIVFYIPTIYYAVSDRHYFHA